MNERDGSGGRGDSALRIAAIIVLISAPGLMFGAWWAPRFYAGSTFDRRPTYGSVSSPDAERQWATELRPRLIAGAKRFRAVVLVLGSLMCLAAALVLIFSG